MTQKTLVVSDEYSGQRLDRVLAQLLPQFSRSFLQAALKEGQITLDGKKVAARYPVKGEEILAFELIENDKIEHWQPEPIDLTIVYEDHDLLVINKPIGLVVHPAAGNWTGTLVNGLLHYNPQLALLPRAGIVHRLDKDTSGLMVIAQSREAHHALVKQLQRREVKREYYALVYGEVTAGGTIDAAMARDPRDRLKMALDITGKSAITHYRIAERLGGFTLLRVNLETGRTHQIRVHLASIHHPIVGDQSYGKGLRLPKQASEEVVTALKSFKHQALHAGKLSFLHPITHQEISFTATLPEDFTTLINLMRI